MDKLTRREIVEEIIKVSGLSWSACDGILDAVIRKIGSSLAAGGSVELRGLGSITPIVCQPRIGRNPKAPENEVLIPARYKLRFRPGYALKARLLKLSKEMPLPPGSDNPKRGAKPGKTSGAARKPAAQKGPGLGTASAKKTAPAGAASKKSSAGKAPERAGAPTKSRKK